MDLRLSFKETLNNPLRLPKNLKSPTLHRVLKIHNGRSIKF